MALFNVKKIIISVIVQLSIHMMMRFLYEEKQRQNIRIKQNL